MRAPGWSATSVISVKSGDAPRMPRLSPSSSIVPNRYSTTVEPGSSSRTACAASGENGAKPVGERMKSAVVWSSIELRNVVLNDCDMIAIAVTSARPIISAAAVDAVRRGFRCAFSRARIPVMRPDRVAGHVSTRAAGGASSGLSIATPMNTVRAEMPTHAAP